jgi:ATP-dependent DNA helicase RecG
VKDDKEPTTRLKELEKSTDGFHLAEVDLKLRGPGEIYGKLQHGAMNLKIASLSDTRLISRAQKAAEEFAKKPENMLEYKELASEIKKYQQLTTLN